MIIVNGSAMRISRNNRSHYRYQCFSGLLLIFCCLITASASAAKLPFISGETLYYKLSYRGILTSMIWADLADVRMTFSTDKATPDRQKGYQFELYLSTENYAKSEIIHPVRYTYTSTLDTSLQRTLLVEEVDTGKNQSHAFLWLDWENKVTQLFKKREKEYLSSGFLGLHSEAVWEPDGTQPIPAFLDKFPVLENNVAYLIHKESGDNIEQSQVLEPLSLIYALRINDFQPDFNEVKEIAIAVSDDIRLYRVQKEGPEDIRLQGKIRRGIKFKIQTDAKKDNYYYVWLSDDQKKIPLRMAMDAPLGKLEIDLIRAEQ